MLAVRAVFLLQLASRDAFDCAIERVGTCWLGSSLIEFDDAEGKRRRRTAPHNNFRWNYLPY